MKVSDPKAYTYINSYDANLMFTGYESAFRCIILTNLSGTNRNITINYIDEYGVAKSTTNDPILGNTSKILNISGKRITSITNAGLQIVSGRLQILILR